MNRYVILSLRVLLAVISISFIILLLSSPFFVLGRIILGNTGEALYYAIYQMISIIAVFIIASIYSGWKNKGNDSNFSHSFIDVPVLIAAAVVLFNIIYFYMKK